ncbi:MAG: YceH family protein [Rubricoccaceae bacterium]
MTRPTLDAVEQRVAGALAEKALATPESYPLTLSALTTACNQKTAREPVTDYPEHVVSDAAQHLARRGLAGTTSGSGHRAVKYRHLLDRALGLGQRELAALTILLLRGPQTAGEIRTRSARLFAFASTDDVEEALWLLADREAPLVVRLPRRPGQAADRYAHLLGGEAGAATLEAGTVTAPAPAQGGDRDALEARVAALEAEVAALREAFETFRASFE